MDAEQVRGCGPQPGPAAGGVAEHWENPSAQKASAVCSQRAVGRGQRLTGARGRRGRGKERLHGLLQLLLRGVAKHLEVAVVVGSGASRWALVLRRHRGRWGWSR